MAENKASATVPIDEDIQRFAIHLDERDGDWMLPLFEELEECFERIRESGEDGVRLTELEKMSELPVSMFFEQLADNHGMFEQADRPDTVRLNNDSGGVVIDW